MAFVFGSLMASGSDSALQYALLEHEVLTPV